MKAIVAERGQVTIPKALRQKLGIQPGTVLDFEIHKNTLIAIKTDIRDPVEKLFGCIGRFITDDVMNELRDRE